MRTINTAFEYDAIDETVWKEELAPRLPERIFDIHSHAWRAEEYQWLEGSDPSTPSVVDVLPLEDLQSIYKRIFPNKEVRALIFGIGDRETDLESQNNWIANEAPGYGYQTLLFARPDWDEETLERQLQKGHLGFKPYWFLAADHLDKVVLEDMISPAMLKLADKYGLIVMTHIPRTGRLADKLNVEGLHKICEAAPRAKFILAHLGRSYFMEAMKYFDDICDIPNLWADCSMVQDKWVISYALKKFPVEKFMFGLDLPMAMEKGKLISVNGQRHFFSKRPHKWSIHAEPGGYAITCTLYAYEIIRAIISGADLAGLEQEQLNSIFWDNAKRLIKLTQESINVAS